MDVSDIALAIASPFIGGTVIFSLLIIRGWVLKSREIKLKEDQMHFEEKRRQDEINAKILQMDSPGIDITEVLQLKEEIRRLKEEMREIKTNLNLR